jgi:flagellar protein FliS
MRQDERLLVEVDGLLATLEEAWIGIGPEVAQAAAANAAAHAI